MTIVTLVHASDIHIGDIDKNPRNPRAMLDARASPHWKVSKHLYGYLGHTYDALVHLASRFMGLVEKEPGVTRLVVTGDLTATGNPHQFLLARTYFEQKIAIEPGNSVGLRTKNALEYAVPGNHDHWPGSRRVLGQPTAWLQANFPNLPGKAAPTLPLGKDASGKPRTLVLAAIDSSKDVSPWGYSRMYARGKFESQIGPLKTALGPRNPNEVRALLLHHSYVLRTPRSNLKKRMEIDHDSFRELTTLIRECDIAVLLTGHVHKADAVSFPVTDDSGASWQALEVRCGTTTARDTPPANWNLSAEKIRRSFHKNTLLVHRIVEGDDGCLYWTTTLEVRKGSGFSPDKELLKIPDIPVWPRP